MHINTAYKIKFSIFGKEQILYFLYQLSRYSNMHFSYSQYRSIYWA